MQSLTFQVKPLHPRFKAPKQATSGAGAFDLYMPEAGAIPATGKVEVGLGFAAAIPRFHAGFLMSIVDSLDETDRGGGGFGSTGK